VDTPGTRTPENGWFRFRIGEIEATVAPDGRMLPHDIAAIFAGLPPDVLMAAKTRLRAKGTHFSMEQNCLVCAIFVMSFRLILEWARTRSMAGSIRAFCCAAWPPQASRHPK
jgi:hypothetical protein